MPETSNRKSRFRLKSKSKRNIRNFEKDAALALAPTNRLQSRNLLARHPLHYSLLHLSRLRLVLDKRVVAADAAVDEGGVDVGGNKRSLKPSPPLRSRDRYWECRPSLRKQESQKIVSRMLQKRTAKCRFQWRLPLHQSFRQPLRRRRCAPPRV